MRFINTKIHGILDYSSGIFLIISPWIFNFTNGGTAQIIPMVIGFIVIVMSLATNYEYGVIKSISMSIHLTIDVIAGIFLVVSPWLFGFADQVYLPHFLLGVLSIGAGLFTKKVPSSLKIPIHG